MIMKKWVVALVILAIIGFGGYKVGMNYMSQKMMDQVTEQVLNKEEIEKMIQDPDIQKTLQEHIGEQGLQKIQQQVMVDSPTGSTAQPESHQTNSAKTEASVPAEKNKPAFSTREEALSFLLSKFSMNELKGFAAKAQGGLTAEEKTEIKSELLSRISPEEFEALKVLGLIELSKSKQ